MPYRIRNWDKNFENHKTRLLKHMAWIPVPTDLGSPGYAELVSGHPDGAAHFGLWIALLEMAAKGAPRGHLTAGIRHHDARSMSTLCRMPVSMIEAAIERLVTIGWLEIWHPEGTIVPEKAPNLAPERQIKDAVWKEGTERKELHTRNESGAFAPRAEINRGYAAVGKNLVGLPSTPKPPDSYQAKLVELTAKYGHPLPPHGVAELNAFLGVTEEEV